MGEIEVLPIEGGTVDCVISNCVINLSTDKQKVEDRVVCALLTILLGLQRSLSCAEARRKTCGIRSLPQEGTSFGAQELSHGLRGMYSWRDASASIHRDDAEGKT